MKFKRCNIILCQYIIRYANESDDMTDSKNKPASEKEGLLLFEISKTKTCLDVAITNGHR